MLCDVKIGQQLSPVVKYSSNTQTKKHTKKIKIFSLMEDCYPVYWEITVHFFGNFHLRQEEKVFLGPVSVRVVGSVLNP